MFVALAVALMVAAYATTRAIAEPFLISDLDHQLVATRALFSGGNPYKAVGPGTAYAWTWPLYYPGPAVVWLLGFAWMPVKVARVLFASVSAGTLCLVSTRRSFNRLPMFLSASMLLCASRAQWAPWLLAAVWSPWLAGFLGAKPNVGAAMVAGWSRWREWRTGVFAGAVVLLISFALMPHWPQDWLANLRGKHDTHIPLLELGGPFVLLALTRWRRPEARLLVAMACVPATPALYDTLPLFVAARTARESVLLALCSHALFLGILALGPFTTFDGYAAVLASLTPVAMYLPAVWMVVRRANAAEPVDAAPSALGRVDLWLVALLVLVSLVIATGTVGAARYMYRG